MNQDGKNREVWDLLGRDEAPEFTDSVWPAVGEAIARRRRSPARRLALAGGGLAAAAAGLALGLVIESRSLPTYRAAEWWEDGTLLVEDRAMTLDAIYGNLFVVADAAAEGE